MNLAKTCQVAYGPIYNGSNDDFMLPAQRMKMIAKSYSTAKMSMETSPVSRINLNK